MDHKKEDDINIITQKERKYVESGEVGGRLQSQSQKGRIYFY